MKWDLCRRCLQRKNQGADEPAKKLYSAVLNELLKREAADSLGEWHNPFALTMEIRGKKGVPRPCICCKYVMEHQILAEGRDIDMK